MSNTYRVPICCQGRLLSVEDGASVPETTAWSKVLVPRWAECCLHPLLRTMLLETPPQCGSRGSCVDESSVIILGGLGSLAIEPRSPPRELTCSLQDRFGIYVVASWPSLQALVPPPVPGLAGVLGNCVWNPPPGASRSSLRQFSFSESPNIHIQALLPITPVVFLIGPC